MSIDDDAVMRRETGTIGEFRVGQHSDADQDGVGRDRCAIRDAHRRDMASHPQELGHPCLEPEIDSVRVSPLGWWGFGAEVRPSRSVSVSLLGRAIA